VWRERAIDTRLAVGYSDAMNLPPLAEIEKRYIVHVLRQSPNVETARKILGIGHGTIYRKIRAWGIQPSGCGPLETKRDQLWRTENAELLCSR
jgi:DNA-binding NtrC family response regulator